MNTRNFSVHLYHKNGRWFLCKNDQCQDFAILNLLTNKKTLVVVTVLTFVAVLVAFAPMMPKINKNTLPATASAHVDAEEARDTIPALTEANLLKEIKEEGIICEKHVLAQAKLESLHLTSYLCRNANNLFGMRYPGRRETTAIGVYLQGQDTIIYGTHEELKKYLTKPTYAVYASWVDAVKDYKLWQDNAFKVEEKYLSFLNRIYAEAPDYVQVVDKMAKNLQD
jgi:hypothetical protein